LAGSASFSGSELHPNQQLGDRDRCDGDIVVVVDRAIEVKTASLGFNQERG
jgi:hypothetical protein